MNREDYQREIIVRLFQTSNALQTYMDKLLLQHNLTTKQFFMMIILGSFEHYPRIGEVSERFGTSRQNVKQVLLKLEKTGFVEMFLDETDSRIKRVRFTNMANQFWMQRNEQDDKTMNRIFDTLTMEELENTMNALKKMFEQLGEFRRQME